MSIFCRSALISLILDFVFAIGVFVLFTIFNDFPYPFLVLGVYFILDFFDSGIRLFNGSDD